MRPTYLMLGVAVAAATALGTDNRPRATLPQITVV
jgi:hypothetical protein